MSGHILCSISTVMRTGVKFGGSDPTSGFNFIVLLTICYSKIVIVGILANQKIISASALDLELLCLVWNLQFQR